MGTTAIPSGSAESLREESDDGVDVLTTIHSPVAIFPKDFSLRSAATQNRGIPLSNDTGAVIHEQTQKRPSARRKDMVVTSSEVCSAPLGLFRVQLYKCCELGEHRRSNFRLESLKKFRRVLVA